MRSHKRIVIGILVLLLMAIGLPLASANNGNMRCGLRFSCGPMCNLDLICYEPVTWEQRIAQFQPIRDQMETEAQSRRREKARKECERNALDHLNGLHHRGVISAVELSDLYADAKSNCKIMHS